MTRIPESRASLAKAVLVASLVLALVIITAASGVIHFHQGDESAANCRICQVAHVPFAPVVVRVVLAAPSRLVRNVSVLADTGYFEPFLVPSHSRAPPA
jgi:hypothetical protein